MIALVLATHGKMAEGVFHAGNMIYGEGSAVKVVSLTHEQGIEEFNNREMIKWQFLLFELMTELFTGKW